MLVITVSCSTIRLQRQISSEEINSSQFGTANKLTEVESTKHKEGSELSNI